MRCPSRNFSATPAAAVDPWFHPGHGTNCDVRLSASVVLSRPVTANWLGIGRGTQV